MPEAETLPEVRTWTDPLTHNEYSVRLCYIDAAGHHWYEFEEPLRMPTARGVEGEFAAEWAKLHLTPEELTAFIDQMVEEGQAGRIVDMFGTLKRLRERTQAMADKKSLAELAKVYFLIDDEPIGWPTAKHNELKDAAWASDPAAKGFFIRTAFVYTHGYSDVSGIDILTYLQAQETIHLQTPRPSAEKKSAAPKTDSSTRGQSFIDNVKRSTRKRT